MGPNEHENLTLFVQVTHIFIFRIYLFFYISGHCFGVLKNSIFGALKEYHVHTMSHILAERKMRKVISENNRVDKCSKQLQRH